jgi:predicted DNA-binding ribbon-helix-helix protein
MSVLTIRVPDAKHQRLKHMAKARGISVNKLIEELSTVALAQHDTEIQLRALAARGAAKRGPSLLDKLDRTCAQHSRKRNG